MTSERPETAVGKSFLRLGTGEAAARIVGFAATLYLARTLGPSVYGTLVVAATVMAYVGIVADCGVDQLGVHDVARDRARLAELVPAYVGARLLVSVALVIILLGIGLVAFPQPEGAILAAYAFTLGPIALGTRWAHLGLERPGVVSLSRMCTAVLGSLLIVAMVREPGGVGLVPLAYIAGEAIGAFVLLRALPRVVASLHTMVRFDVVASLFTRSWPVVANGLLGLVVFNSDSFFLRVFRDSTTVGYYGAAYSVVGFILNLGLAYSMSLLPVMTRVRDEPERKEILYHSATATVFAGVLPIALGGFLVAGRLIPALQGNAYRPAVIPLQILLLSLPIGVVRHVAFAVLIAHGRQGQMLKAGAWAAAGNIALNLALIPIWGMNGAAVATLLTETIRTVPMLAFVRSAGVSLTPPGRFWRTIAAGGAMGLAVTFLGSLNVWVTIAVGGLVYVLALFAVGGIRFRRGALPELMV